MTGGILEGDCVQDHGGRLEVVELGDPLKNAESSDKSRLDSNTSTLYVKKIIINKNRKVSLPLLTIMSVSIKITLQYNL